MKARYLVAMLAAAGCTNADLYGVGTEPNYANKISLQGDVCTEDPSAVSFPVKTLIVMDGTAQFVQADPTASRAAAVRALLDRYAGRNYHYGMIQYATQAHSLTGGFAEDTILLQTGIDAITVGLAAEAQRSYLDALRVAATAIGDDILASPPGDRSRTRYVVLFVAAGPPTPSLPDFWCPAHNLTPGSRACSDAFNTTFCPDDIPVPTDCERVLYRRLVNDLRDFVRKNGAQDFVFHSFSLSSAARADVLLKDMAEAGHGVSVTQSPGSLNLLQVDIARTGSLLIRRELVVYNGHAVLRGLRPVADSDEDGLTDDEEEQLGTDPLCKDTDGDSVGDAIEHRLAAPSLTFDPLVANVPPVCTTIVPPDNDSDSDGLNDCEEAILRTDPSLLDSDRDGIPDIVEVQRGGNPLSDDLLGDSDQDGVVNGDELKEGLDVGVNDAQRELEYGYRYRIFDEGTRTQLEAVPNDPFSGVKVIRVGGSTSGVGQIHYEPGPPATLSWSEDAKNLPPGAPVDISRGGTFTLRSSGQQTIDVRIDPKLLPPVTEGAKDFLVLVRPTLRSCFHFDARNITLVQTAEILGGRPGPGWNTLRVYFGQVPEENLGGHTIYDLATVPVRFLEPDRKTPNRAFIQLEQDNFVLVGGAP